MEIFDVILLFLIQTVWSCTERTVNVGSPGVIIKTDGFPYRNYGNSIEQCWIITNVDGDGLQIMFNYFRTEPFTDLVTIYGTNNGSVGLKFVEEKILSGWKFSPQVTVSGTKMKVQFKSDISVTLNGWQACVCPGTESCECNWGPTPDDIIRSTTVLWPSWKSSSSWSTSSPENDGGISTDDIAGIVVSGVVFFGFLIYCSICVARCNIHQTPENARTNVYVLSNGGNYNMHTVQNPTPPPTGYNMHPVTNAGTYNMQLMRNNPGQPTYPRNNEGPDAMVSSAPSAPTDPSANEPPSYSMAVGYPMPAQPIPEVLSSDNPGQDTPAAPPPPYDSLTYSTTTLIQQSQHNTGQLSTRQFNHWQRSN